MTNPKSIRDSQSRFLVKTIDIGILWRIQSKFKIKIVNEKWTHNKYTEIVAVNPR